jgi:hypothetical protein
MDFLFKKKCKRCQRNLKIVVSGVIPDIKISVAPLWGQTSVVSLTLISLAISYLKISKAINRQAAKNNIALCDPGFS